MCFKCVALKTTLRKVKQIDNCGRVSRRASCGFKKIDNCGHRSGGVVNTTVHGNINLIVEVGGCVFVSYKKSF